MITRDKHPIAIEAMDEPPFCRKVCARWGECRGEKILRCHFIQTILAIQEQRHNVEYTLAGKSVTKAKAKRDEDDETE